MDSEDICLSVFLCIYVDEGMGGKNKLSVPSRTCESGYVRQNQVDYTHRLSRTRVCETKPGRLYPPPLYIGAQIRNFAVISPVDTGISGRR